MIEEQWLVQFLETGAPVGTGVAFDIGANAGEWTGLLADRCGHVVAVEPDARAFAVAKEKTRPCDMAINAAAADSDGTVTLYMRPSAAQTSLLVDHPIGAGGQADAPIVEQVASRAITLDSLAEMAARAWGIDRVDFVKIDVEGAEGLVLRGATSAAFAETRWLIEVHDRQQEVEAELVRLGFTQVTHIKHPIRGAHPRHFWFYADKRGVPGQ
jgi:FkbM family methyltransferase